MKLLWSFFFLFLVVSISSCKRENAKNTTTNGAGNHIHPEAQTLPSTLAMIQKVEEAYSRIDPAKVGYILNGRRARILEENLKTAQPQERLFLRYTLAQELLKSGEIDKSISIFMEFLNYFKTQAIPNKGKILSKVKKQLALAYLRKGEQDNCIANHNNESCIIPISKKAQHKLILGSESAIGLLKEVLSQDPKDFRSQYLLNVAYMTLGLYPGQVPLEYRIPESYFNTKKDFPKFENIAMDLGLDVDGISGGTCVDDFNNDGYLDIIASSWGPKDQIRYFENNGKGGFTERTSSSGLSGVTGGLNLRHADYNNDGNVDFVILRGAWLGQYGRIPNSLIRNNGDGTFEDVTLDSGIYSLHPTQTATWSDFDRDGWLDLFIANESSLLEPNNCELFMNNADGTFTNVAKESNIGEKGFFKGAATGDVNNDGYPDIYLSNYNGKNLLYINNTPKKKQITL